MMKFIPAIEIYQRLALAIVLAGLDRFSKAAVFDFLLQIPGKRYFLTPFLNFSEVWNRGVSFGLFSADTMYGVIGLLCLTGGILLFLLYKLFTTLDKIEGFAFALIISGAIGNIYDRFFYGAVYDFIDFHWSGFHFWTFNIADAAISVGAVLLLFRGVFPAPPEKMMEERK
jgi:signal peptidase II